MQASWRRRLALAVSILIFGAFAGGCGFFPKEEDEPAPQLATPVKSEKETYTVKRGNIVDEVILAGRFAPARQQDMSFPNAGRVQAVYVSSGDKVKAGQVLAELHMEEIEYQLKQAQIRLQKASLALEDAKYNAQFGHGHAIDSELKSRQLDVDGVQLEVSELQSRLQAAKLIAPFEGQVTSVSAKPGDAVNAYEMVVAIADPSTLTVEADIDDASLTKVVVGQKAVLEFADLGSNGSGRVVQLPDPAARATDTKTEPRRMKVRPDTPTPGATIGSVGRVHVILQQKMDVLLLDKSAIHQYGGRTYVVIKTPRREVDVVQGIVGETEVEILKGLALGDEVMGR